MFKIELKLLTVISLLLSDILTVCSQITPGAPTENVVVTVKNTFKPEEVTAALNRDNQSEHAKYKPSGKPSTLVNFARTARAKTSTSSVELFTCAISLDAPCLMDHVENIVDNANDNLLEQADAEARRISVGRADSEEETAPSSLIASIAQMLLELPEVLKDSLGGMFRSDAADLEIQESSESDSDEEEDDDEEDDEEDDNDVEESKDDDTTEEVDGKESESTTDDEHKAKVESKESDEEFDGFIRKKCSKKKGCSYGMGGSGGGGDFSQFAHFSHGTTSSEVGDGRGKKKKKKKAIVKLLLLGLIIKAKITLLLKLLAAKLQVKFLLIAAANLLLNLARFWWDLKKGAHHEQPQKVIYYEHAQHQHHYDGGDEWQSGPGGGGHWGRAYENEETSERSAQDLAYSQQLPKGTTYTRVNDKPNISWNPFG